MTKKRLVQYYDEGWRTEFIVSQGRKWTKVRKILPLGAKPQKRGHLFPFITVANSDVRECAA
jgi:hypothetical protein